MNNCKKYKIQERRSSTKENIKPSNNGVEEKLKRKQVASKWEGLVESEGKRCCQSIVRFIENFESGRVKGARAYSPYAS